VNFFFFLSSSLKVARFTHITCGEAENPELKLRLLY